MPLGEPSVVVAVSAAHRGEAFAGAREAIDRIKAEAPIWKRRSRATASRGAGSRAPLPAVREPGRLTHLDEAGNARMVDVGAKPETERRARAEARLRMSPETAAAVARGDAPKGDVLGTARLAGIGAAKRTWELIPLAHPLALDFVDVEGRVDADAGLVALSAEAGTTARTGVEMEAMTACAVAALTVYDMVKGLERGVVDRGDRAGREERRAQRRLEARVSHGAREPGELGAAVLTISTSRARGEGEDESGPALAAFAERARRDGDRHRGDPRRARADRGPAALVVRRGRLRARPDDRRHRVLARRRHPGGDPRRDRARGAGDRRGDARRVARAHARCGWSRAASPAPAGAP